jgi:CubicO group peptidase (beta-lactamase class C family)
MSVGPVGISRRTAVKLLSAMPVACSTGVAATNPLRARLESWLSEIVSKGWTAGAAVEVIGVSPEPLILLQGNADPEAGRPVALDTIYRIYSMTKPVTAAAMMTLVESGAVGLDQPVADFLPESRTPRVFVRFDGDEVVTEPARRPITIRHLLTHTSGMSESFNKGLEPTALLYERAGLRTGRWYDTLDIRTLEQLVRRLSKIPLAAHPGEKWIYGSSLDVAGRVIEAAAGQGFSAFMQEKIFAPLRMPDTGFSPPEDKNRLAALYRLSAVGSSMRVPPADIPAWGENPVVPTGGTGLFSTLPDYARFVRMLINRGALDGARILSAKSVETMMTDQLGPELGETPLSAAARFGLGGEVAGLGFGLGGSVLRDPSLAGGIGSRGEYAWGGAASTTFWVDPVKNIAVILMTQKMPSGAHPFRDQLRKIVYGHLQ